MVPEKITSRQNPRVKELVKLRDRGPRDAAGLFLVEGFREVRRALEKGVPLSELYYSPEWFLGGNEGGLLERARAAGTALFEMSRDVFAKSPTARGRTGCWRSRRSGGGRWRTLRRGQEATLKRVIPGMEVNFCSLTLSF